MARNKIRQRFLLWQFCILWENPYFKHLPSKCVIQPECEKVLASMEKIENC